MGLKYTAIQSALEIRHGYNISLRHLKRRIAELGGSRRTYTDLGVLVDFIRDQLQNLGQLHGYRWMFEKCCQHGLRVRKEDVRLILRELDPRGVTQRQAGRLRRRQYFSRGPNFIWHLDGYDKLKPYGICINGCIDGFSRKMIWLNAYTTNSDPRLIGGYYLEAVERLQGCPRVVRGDLGTENGRVAAFQRFLVPIQPDDTLNSYLEGASTANQRIEYWWGFLRRQCAEFWIAIFGELKDNGHLDGGFLDKSLIQFCCMGLVQDELDDTAQTWNAHTIRPSRNPNVPSGCPNIMYALPELYLVRDHLCPVQSEHLDVCRNECRFRKPIPCDKDVYSVCIDFMVELNLQLPGDPYQAVNLYMHLREAIKSVLQM
ncbi:hypothetical protein N1851_028967 [Merluccius polli]|uniref:Integrase core domain-containing protein n=1 Tax=Merluccius polli TaxID=89951 RepID=A0AA47M842_MERPO|nr:hypothetical protein N1851_028967 [Merluccius polli]